MKFIYFLSLFLLFNTAIFASERIGLYSGTFDPFHLGHLYTIETSLAKGDIDRMIVYPNLKANNKSPILNFDQRYDLLRRAVKGRVEIILPSKKLLKNILSQDSPHKKMQDWVLSKYNNNEKVVRVMGTDSFEKMTKIDGAVEAFKKNKRIEMIVMNREGYEKPSKLSRSSKVKFVESRLNLNFSSSEYRKDPLLHEGKLPKEVAKEIKRKGFYKRGKERGIYDLPKAIENQIFLEQLQNERIEDTRLFSSIKENNGLKPTYLPEKRPIFRISTVEIPIEEVEQIKTGGRYPSDLVVSNSNKKYVKFFIHPESEAFFKKRFKKYKWKKEYLATPTSSHRSLMVWDPLSKKAPMGIKVSLNVEIGETVRLLTSNQIKRASSISYLLNGLDKKKLLREGIVFIDEPYSVYPKDHPYGFSFREVPKLDTEKELMPMFSLYSRGADGSKPPIIKMIKKSSLSPRDFVTNFFIEPLVRQQAYLAFTEGLVGEPHEQNVLIELKNGKPTKNFYYRDLGGYTVKKEMRLAGGQDMSFLRNLGESSLKADRSEFVDGLKTYLRKSNFFALMTSTKSEFPEINGKWLDQVFREHLFSEIKKFTGISSSNLREAKLATKSFALKPGCDLISLIKAFRAH